MSENRSKSRQKLSFEILSKLQIWIINYEHHWDIFSFSIHKTFLEKIFKDDTRHENM